MSELFEHVVSALGTEHRLTTAYNPQTNTTKHVNCTLKAAIYAYVGDKHIMGQGHSPDMFCTVHGTS